MLNNNVTIVKVWEALQTRQECATEMSQYKLQIWPCNAAAVKAVSLYNRARICLLSYEAIAWSGMLKRGLNCQVWWRIFVPCVFLQCSVTKRDNWSETCSKVTTRTSARWFILKTRWRFRSSWPSLTLSLWWVSLNSSFNTQCLGRARTARSPSAPQDNHIHHCSGSRFRHEHNTGW